MNLSDKAKLEELNSMRSFLKQQAMTKENNKTSKVLFYSQIRVLFGTSATKSFTFLSFSRLCDAMIRFNTLDDQ